MQDLVLSCPHCDHIFIVAVQDIRCQIFRHAVFKSTGQPIPPHSTKATIDLWKNNGEIWGCGKPFRLFYDKDEWRPEICDYI